MLKNSIIKKNVKSFFIQRYKELSIVILGLMTGIYFHWEILDITVFVIFLWSILGPIPSYYLGRVSLVLLIFLPFLLFLEQKEFAEKLSVYCYYFIVMAVIRAIVELKTNSEND